MSACDTNPDPKLVSDESISINDGPAPYSWLSQDIRLNFGIILRENKAELGLNNILDVRVYRNNISLGADTRFINVELWICDPTLAPTPKKITSSRKLLDSIIDPQQLPAGGNAWISIAAKKVTPANYPNDPAIPMTLRDQPTSVSQNPGNPPQVRQINWMPNALDSVQNTGHKCLIARCFKDGIPGAQADNDCFHVQDTHVAQLNLAIVPSGTFEQESRQRRLRFQIKTNNTDLERSEAATLKVLADLNPSQKVRDILTPSLENFPGYRHIVRSVPTGFKLETPDFPDATVRDNTKLGCFGAILAFLGFLKGLDRQPKYEADIKLNPGQETQITFEADLSRSAPGDAHVFHIMHVNSDQRVIGGFTLVAVVD